jgi:hypothetical protein
MGDSVNGVDYDYVLARLAEEVGGRRETVLTPMALESALAGFRPDLTATYRLSYTSPGGRRAKKVEVSVARPGAQVRLVGRPR